MKPEILLADIYNAGASGVHYNDNRPENIEQKELQFAADRFVLGTAYHQHHSTSLVFNAPQLPKHAYNKVPLLRDHYGRRLGRFSNFLAGPSNPLHWNGDFTIHSGIGDDDKDYPQPIERAETILLGEQQPKKQVRSKKRIRKGRIYDIYDDNGAFQEAQVPERQDAEFHQEERGDPQEEFISGKIKHGSSHMVCNATCGNGKFDYQVRTHTDSWNKGLESGVTKMKSPVGDNYRISLGRYYYRQHNHAGSDSGRPRFARLLVMMCGIVGIGGMTVYTGISLFVNAGLLEMQGWALPFIAGLMGLVGGWYGALTSRALYGKIVLR